MNRGPAARKFDRPQLSFRVSLPTASMLLRFLAALATLTALGQSPRGAGPARTCWSYWYDTVTVTGTVSRRVYPGPPNYESIRRGDEPQVALLLRLDTPLCTKASRDYAAYANVREVQVLADDADFRFAEKHLGQRIRIKATLTGADVGYHHTDVLIDATNKQRQIALAR